MKCPKCGYHSFDQLDNCRKCGKDLLEHKVKFNLRGFFSPGLSTATGSEAITNQHDEEPEQPDVDSVDFGFDFLDEEDSPVGKPVDDISLGDDTQAINIDQPFGADSETIPAGMPAKDSKRPA